MEVQPAAEICKSEAAARPLRHTSVHHAKFNITTQQWSDPESDSTIDTLLEAVSTKVPKEHGIQIFFLPPIAAEDHPSPGQRVLCDDPELCKDLVRGLRLDPFFMTRDAWNSNGFLLSQQNWGNPSNKLDGYSYATRFLIKFLRDKTYFPKGPAHSEYSWLFLAFSILWVKSSRNEPSCVVVCYDDSAKVRDEIKQAFVNYPLDNLKESPFAVYDVLLRCVVRLYDNALWLFREPVRDKEKKRLVGSEEVYGHSSHNEQNMKNRIDRHVSLHELARHAIHMSETIQAASSTVQLAIRNIEIYSSSAKAESKPINTIIGLQSSANSLETLKLRSDSFVKRIANEIDFAYNIMGVCQLNATLAETKKLVEESKDDSKSLTKLVTTLTLMFLPASFVSGFWGMNFISTEGDHLVVSGSIWVFFLSAVVAVVVCSAIYLFTDHQAKRNKGATEEV